MAVKNNAANVSSLRRKLLLAFLASMTISLAAFLVTYSISKSLLGDYFANTSYVIDRERECVTALEEYVSQNQIPATDSWSLKKWAKANDIIILAISRDRAPLYENASSADSPLLETDSLQAYKAWQFFYQVEFADGTADVFLYKNFQKSYYLRAILLCAGISMALWTILLLLFTTPQINALQRMQAQNAEQEALVLGMAHDLRTPLTGLLGYLEVCRRCEKDPESLDSHLKKAIDKTLQIRSLSDKLFDFFLSSEGGVCQLDPPARAEYLLRDYLSEFCSELTLSGFSVDADALEWPEADLQINSDFMGRIINNLLSNVIKYADPRLPVQLSSACSGHYLMIDFRNHIKKSAPEIQGTRIGMRNVEKLMQRMNGRVKVKREEDDLYQIALFFPLIKENQFSVFPHHPKSDTDMR